MTLEKLQVIIEAKTAPLKKDLNKVQSEFSGFEKNINKKTSGISSSFGKMFKAAVIVRAAKQAAQALKGFTDEAIQTEAQISNLGRTMGENAKDFMQWAKNDAVAFGIGEASAIKFGNAFSNLISGFINDTSNVAGYTKQLLEASAVIASKTGRTIEDVNERIRSGLLGNTESIEDLGVNVNVAMLEMTNAFQQMANGRSWEQLNFYEQQQIRLFAILEQSATKYGTTLSGGVATNMLMFQAQLANLRLELGRAFVPVVNSVLPALSAMVSWLVNATKWVGAFIKALGGKSEVTVQANDMAKATGVAAGNSNKINKGLGKAAKAAKEIKNNLAGFDEINLLNTGNGDSAAAGAGSGAGADAIGISGGMDIGSKQEEPAIDISFVEKWPLFVQMKSAWDGLVESAKQFGESVDYLWNNAGLKELVELFLAGAFIGAVNTLSGCLKIMSGVLDVISGLVETITGLLTGDWTKACDGAGKVTEGLGKILEGVFIIILGKDCVEAIKDFIQKWWENMSDWWKNKVAPWFTKERWIKLWDDVKTWWNNGWESIKNWWDKSALAAWWRDYVAPWFTKEQWIKLWNDTCQWFIDGWNSIVEWWNKSALVAWWRDDVAPWFKWDTWKTAWSDVKESFNTGWNDILTWWKDGGLTKWYNDHCAKWFKWDTWKTAWNDLKEGFKQGFKNAVNGAIDIVNRFIRWLNQKLSFSWDALTIAGKQIFPAGSIQLCNISEIPAMAKGGIVSRATLAQIGENGKEAVLPLENNTNWMNLLAEKLSEIGGYGNNDITIKFSGSGANIVRMLKPELDKENNRRGTNLVLGGV